MSTNTATTPHTPWARVVVLGVAAAAIVGIILLAFTWPGMNSSAKNIPLAVTGPASQVQTVTKALDQRAGDTFDITTVEGRQEAVDRIEARDAFGAIVLGKKPEVLAAGANGAAVTQIMKGVSQQLQGQLAQAAAKQQAAQAHAPAAGGGNGPASGSAGTGGAPEAGQQAPQVAFTDVVPLLDEDPKGTGLALASFPLAMGGMLGGILVSLLVAGNRRRITALVVFATLAGGIIAVVMQGMYGVLAGNALLNMLAAGLAVLGTSSLIVGLNALIGTLGIPVGAVLTMLVANPLSGARAPWQFLPEPWGAVGQWFVPGASSTLLKDLSYFPEANTTFAWLVLAGWAVLGVVFTLAGHFRNQEVVHTEDAHAEDATAGDKPATAGSGKHRA